MWTYVGYLLSALILIGVLKFVFKFGVKTIIKFIINIIIGGLILYLVNYIPGININIDLFKAIVVGVLGIPGAIIVIIYYFIVER